MSKRLKEVLIFFIIGLVFVGYQHWHQKDDSSSHQRAKVEQLNISTSSKRLQTAFEQQQSDIQVQGEGRVIKVLPDDNKGIRHQRFILKLDSGQTLLVAHNIDLAPKLAGLKKGDQVEFYGEYEWSDKGGVIHWTHHDPHGRHTNGWLRFNGTLYQ